MKAWLKILTLELQYAPIFCCVLQLEVKIYIYIYIFFITLFSFLSLKKHFLFSLSPVSLLSSFFLLNFFFSFQPLVPPSYISLHTSETHLPKPIMPRPHLPKPISLRFISLSPITDLLCWIFIFISTDLCCVCDFLFCLV